MADMVNHPLHYNNGGVECIDAIKAAVSSCETPYEGFLVGSILRYIWRYSLKNGVEDLEKAQVYLGWLIETERENED